MLIDVEKKKKRLTILELLYCNGNIFLGLMVVTAGRKGCDFLELMLPAERITLFGHRVEKTFL